LFFVGGKDVDKMGVVFNLLPQKWGILPQKWGILPQKWGILPQAYFKCCNGIIPQVII